jgi:mono/diheme cytochrome c family protein
VKGWKAWRAAACERCHGAAQEGMVGPSLIASLKVLSRDEFRKVLLEGRLEKGMPSHPYLEPKLDDLYAYLKGRSDGSIANVRPDGA